MSADKLETTVKVDHEVVACKNCKAMAQRIEDLEGALTGAQNIIRQLRDAVSTVKETP